MKPIEPMSDVEYLAYLRMQHINESPRFDRIINKLNEREPMNNTVGKVVQWHKDRNLIDGATDESQSVKLLEEYVELIASLYPSASAGAIGLKVQDDIDTLYKNDRIKAVKPEDAQEAKKDAIGDQMVVLINIAERNGWSIEECLESAYDEIKNRKGKMIDGSFIKEGDL